MIEMKQYLRLFLLVVNPISRIVVVVFEVVVCALLFVGIYTTSTVQYVCL
jgi:hypothetical protein